MEKFTRYFLALALVAAVLPVVARKQPAVVSQADRRKASYIFLEAQAQKSQGNNEAFYDLTRYAHQIDTSNVSIAYYLGYCMLSMQDVTQPQFLRGMQLMRRYVDQNPAAYYEVTLYSDACMYAGNTQEGLRVLKNLEQATAPAKPELLMRLADGYARNGDYGEAIAVCDTIERHQGKSVQVSAKKVAIYQMNGDTLGAVNELRSLLATAPRNVDYNLALATMFQKTGQNDSALHYIDVAQRLEPDNGAPYLARAQYYAAQGDSVAYDHEIYQALVSKELDVDTKLQVLTDYSNHLLASNDSSQRVVNLFNVLIDQHPHEAPIRDLYSQYLAVRQDYKGAAEQLAYELDLDPTDVKAWQRLMFMDMFDNNYAGAVQAATRALQLNPDNIELYQYVAPAYYEMKQYDKALETYDMALQKIDSTNTELRSNLVGGKGDVYYARGDTAQAFAAYDEALRINPQNVSIMNNYAYFLAQSNRDLPKAESMSAKAVQAYPDNSTFIDTYAWVFYKEKDYETALLYIEAAVRNDSEGSADILDHYGDILEANGKHEQAVEQWRKAYEKNPSLPGLKEKVQAAEAKTQGVKE